MSDVMIPTNPRIYDSLAKTRIQVGGEEDPARENAGTRVALTFVVLTNQAQGGRGSEETERIQIWVTIPQIASLVWWWFRPVLPSLFSPKNQFTRFLGRLMSLRWKTMTSEMAKGGPPEGGEFTMPQYFRREIGNR